MTERTDKRFELTGENIIYPPSRRYQNENQVRGVCAEK